MIRTLLQTINFVTLKHQHQTRKSLGHPPYLVHLLRVAELLSEYCSEDIGLIQAGLLHDVIEDTNTSYEEIKDAFGQTVADIVREKTDDKSLPWAERKRLQVMNAPKKSHEAKQVGLADKCSNLEDLINGAIPIDWPVERVQQYCAWALLVCEGLKDGSPKLFEKIKQMLEGEFAHHDGKLYRCLNPRVSGLGPEIPKISAAAPPPRTKLESANGQPYKYDPYTMGPLRPWSDAH